MELPHDILRVIGAHWAGHRLLYTCTALYASWNPADYAVAESKKIVALNRLGTVTSITTNLMPNGAYHGKCVATEEDTALQSNINEIITYERGRLTSLMYVASHKAFNLLFCRIISISNNLACEWKLEKSFTGELLDIQKSHGRVQIKSSPPNWTVTAARHDVPFCDFAAMANEMASQLPRGSTYPVTKISQIWGRPMPDTRW